MYNKKTDLTGPGISTYDEVKKILPDELKRIYAEKNIFVLE